MGESIDLVCPRASNTTSTSSSSSSSSIGGGESYDYAVIYRVGSRHEFDNCIIDPNNYETVAILKCDKPHSPQLVKFTIYFVKYSPVPNALEFEEDKEYFFLSTSSGARQGLHYESGGLCAKFNMRFSITIQSGSGSKSRPNNNNNNNNSLLSKLTSSSSLDDDLIPSSSVDSEDINELDEVEPHRNDGKADSSVDSGELKMSNMNLVVSSGRHRLKSHTAGYLVLVLSMIILSISICISIWDEFLTFRRINPLFVCLFFMTGFFF